MRAINEEIEALNLTNSGSTSMTESSPCKPEPSCGTSHLNGGLHEARRQDKVISLLTVRAAALRQLEEEEDAPTSAAARQGMLRGRRVYGEGSAGEGTLATFNGGTSFLALRRRSRQVLVIFWK